jgi:hypothetical protein
VARAEFFEIPLDGGCEAQIVQQRRVQQVREIAHRRQSAIGNRSGVVEQARRTADRVDRALGDGQFDLDGREDLTDLVVQFPRDRASLFLLRANQLRGKMMELARVAAIARALTPDALLEATGLDGREQTDAE